MSLAMWLPLNGDLHNQGLADITVTNNGATVDNSGKIGQCYSFNGNNNYLYASYNFYNSRYSVCAWIYTTSSSATQTIICDRTTVGCGFSIFLIGGKLRIDCGGNSLQWTTAYTYPINTWFHLTVAYDGNIVYYYINGEFKEKKAQTLVSSYWGTITSIGASQMNGSGYGNYLNGKLNDIRIYDHALSAKEVEEIAKGLVLHYKLDNNGLGNPNLLPCGGTYVQSSPWTTTLNRVDGYAWVTNSAFKATPGKTYTISVKCDGTLANAHGQSANPSAKSWTFWLYICNSDTTKSWQAGAWDTPVNLTSVNYNYRKISDTHVWTYTLSNTQGYISLRTNSYSNGTDNVTINWWNMKVEEGDNFTGWTPNFANASIIYDSSGYGNNGTIVGSLATTTPSPRYSCATKFDGNTSCILIENLQLSDIINTAVTYSFWIKPNGENGARSIYFGSYVATSWSIEKTTGNKLRLYWNGSPDETSSAVITDEEWQHIVITKSGTNDIKVYLNGELTWTSTATHNNLTFPTTYRIGRDTRSGDGTPYHGDMSDFRIYATALTPEQVKELYNTSMSIDNNGNIHARELIVEDTNNTSTNKRGQLLVNTAEEEATIASFIKPNKIECDNLYEY